MIKASYPWPTPPSTYREEHYRCNNCGSEKETLSVGTWMHGFSFPVSGKLVLCKACFKQLTIDIVGKEYIHDLKTRLKVLFTGKLP